MAREVWECEFQGAKSYGAFGPREVLIVASSETVVQREDVVARKKGQLAEEDRERLDSQGLSQDSWDDEVALVKARYIKDSVRYRHISAVQGQHLTQKEVLEKIGNLFEQTLMPGVVIHYIGHGKRQTGDWCFKDGFLSFSAIAHLYRQLFFGKVLELYCDCSYSGNWVTECRTFLDQCQTQPCGHSARKTDMLIKVRTSCLPDQIGYSWMFAARGCGNDKNNGRYFINEAVELCPEQKTCDIDSTMIMCGKLPDEECCLNPEFTYHTKQNYSERLEVAVQVHNGKKAWYLVLLHDDANKIRDYRRKTQGAGAAISLGEYGMVLESGWGEKPPLQLLKDIRIGIKTYRV